MTEQTLFTKLGGQETIDKVVDSFYDKVLADPLVNPFFVHTDMAKQRRHQAAFIGFALGSGAAYTGKSMAKAHEGMNLQPEHFHAIAAHLKTTLEEFGVAEEDVSQVLVQVSTLRDDILYK
ncbi:group 1 truncated hemoglobin [Paenibacillus sambharensis]|uniref:Group 1 truncated hemoglobin n=1 Tax=Paenibacillus sambharensis TaxID=1803190 RepID=A0A2W1LL11_9BACL|nr:group 1 truncated hemoglobin [Paenibacillus sambharensis]PZD95585.1 group 1 truncated hemoglobin [Paenibacillus sambharensis]